jgi:hypothetical protein
MSISVKDATGATQTINTLPNTGQATSSNSSPVVIANDQSAIAVSGPLTDTQLRATALALPTGAATSAKQDTQQNTLATLALESGGNLSAILAALQAGSSSALLAGEAHIGSVSGQSSLISASLTRPADTTAYTALDALSSSTSSPTLLTFTNIARINEGSGYLVKARLVTNQPTNAARFRLHLYNTAVTAINDNAPFTLLYANRATKIGTLDFDALGTEGSGSDCAEATNASARLKFVCAAASRTIYGILETRDGFTPTSGQLFFVELMAEID